MKNSMMKNVRMTSLSCLVFFGTSLMADPGMGVELYTSDTETPEPKKSSIEVSYAVPSMGMDDNEAAVAAALGLIDKGHGGIERLYWENDPDADWRIFLDSRFIAQPDDFSVSLEATKPDEKYLTIEFKYWQSYDHGAGIYYPDRDAYFVLNPEALLRETKRFKIGYRFLPSDTSSWKLEYSLFHRKGESLSTRFGDDYQYRVTGLKSRGIVPALNAGEEEVHTVDFEYKNQNEVDRKGFRVHFQRRESDRSRVAQRGVSDPSATRYQRQDEVSKDDLYGFSAFKRKQLTDSMYGSLGVAFTRLDGDITGNRVFGADPEASYNIDFAASQLDDRGYLDLDADRMVKQWIVNANVVFDPEGNHRWMAGSRYERMESSLFSSYLDTWNTVDFQDFSQQRQEADMLALSKKEANDLSGFVEWRYKGYSKAQFYSRLEAGKQDGDLDESWSREELKPESGSSVSLLDRATGFDRERLFWEAGVNYYPSTRFRVSLQGYLKSRKNEYDYSSLILDPADWTAYPGFIEEQEFSTEDLNARVHWKIASWLKSVSRVDFQNTTIDSTGRGLDTIESADRERVVFNQSLVFTPHPRFFMNASYQLVDDLTETGASALESPFDGIITNIPNDYWQIDLNVFYVLTKTIDFQLGYHYLEMSNYLDTSPKTVPYGSDIEQEHASLNFIFHFSESTVARVGFAYYEQTDLSANGNQDYSVHLIKTSLQKQF